MLALVLVAIGIRLGMWQIGRAQEKNALIEQFEQGATGVVELTAANIATLPRYQRVHLSGHYDAQHQVLLDNMPSQGQAQPGWPGFRVLTPLLLNGGGWLLVDRGWVPMQMRTRLPAVAVGEDPRALVGRLDELPQPGMRMGEQAMDDPAASWPRLMNFPTESDLQRALDRPLATRIVRLDADQPDGYERTWHPTFGMGPQRHIGYAVQWFALSAAVLTIYLVLSFKRAKP